MAEERSGAALPAYVVGVTTVVIVLVIGLVFSDGRIHIGLLLGWVVCAGLTALVVTRHLRIAGVVDEGPGLAVAYDALPILLSMAWVVLIAALLTVHWFLAAVAGALAIYHLVLV